MYLLSGFVLARLKPLSLFGIYIDIILHQPVVGQVDHRWYISQALHIHGVREIRKQGIVELKSTVIYQLLQSGTLWRNLSKIIPRAWGGLVC